MQVRSTWFYGRAKHIISLMKGLGGWYTKKTFGKHEGVKLVGFLDYETCNVYVEEYKIYDVTAFHGFLKENPRLELVFWAPYSPNLNKIEELWGWLKDSVINNVFF